jgi:2-keto-3-deoxy-L-rhamnonate aldolase RhmA
VSRTKAYAADVLVVAQIEDVEAVRSIDEIAKVDGLDCLFVGPADLGASIGLVGDEAHQAVEAALHEAIAPAASADGKLLGCFVSGAEEAVHLVERGCALVAVSGTTLIASCYHAVAEAYRSPRTHSANHTAGGSDA